jgi:hypothetical protein
MADFTFNIAKGKAREYYDRVANNDPANSALVIVVINTSAADATLIDLDTLAAVLANGDTAEVGNTGYSRIVLTDSDITVSSPDDTNDRIDLDLDDFAWGAITDDDVDWTDILVCYDSDTTGGTDANIVPIDCFDFEVSIDGSSVTTNLNAAGFHRFANA